MIICLVVVAALVVGSVGGVLAVAIGPMWYIEREIRKQDRRGFGGKE